MAKQQVAIKDVAREAGVSVGTVSNVINRPETVSEPIRERVQEVVRRLGYVRSESARQLRAGASRMIALLGEQGRVFGLFVRGVVAGAQHHAEPGCAGCLLGATG